MDIIVVIFDHLIHLCLRYNTNHVDYVHCGLAGYPGNARTWERGRRSNALWFETMSSVCPWYGWRPSNVSFLPMRAYGHSPPSPKRKRPDRPRPGTPQQRRWHPSQERPPSTCALSSSASTGGLPGCRPCTRRWRSSATTSKHRRPSSSRARPVSSAARLSGSRSYEPR